MASITKQQIFDAAARITADGATPTLAAIRAAVGGGSYTTISEALKEWKAVSPVTATAAPIREQAPSELHAQLSGVIDDAWSKACAMANDRLASERAALEQVRIGLEQAHQDAVAMADTISAELEAAQATIAAQATEAATTATTIEQISASMAMALAAESTTQAALAEAHGRIDQLTALLATEQAARAAATASEAAAATANAVLTEQLTATTARLQESEQSLSNIKHDLAESVTTLATARQAKAVAEAVRDETRQQAKEAGARAEEAEKRARDQAAAAATAAATGAATAAAAMARAVAAEQQLTDMRGEIADLRKTAKTKASRPADVTGSSSHQNQGLDLAP